MKEVLKGMLKAEIDKKTFWQVRERASAWNDDGKGGHIPADKEILKCDARIELLNKLIHL